MFTLLLEELATIFNTYKEYKFKSFNGCPLANMIRRYLGISNITLSLPTRSDHYRAYPLEVKHTAISSSNTGTNKAREPSEPKKYQKSVS